MLKTFSNSPLARNTAWMMVGQGLRLVIQALYFIEIARSLGVRNYGAFVGVVALVAIVGASDLFGLNIVTISGQAFQSFDRLNWTAIINVLMSAGRLLGAIILVALHPHPSPLQWGYIYFSCTATVAVFASIMVSTALGRPLFRHPFSRLEMREGFYFSAGQTAQTVYNDIDKTMLARLGTLEATGIYGAAYRLIDVS